VRLLAAVAAVMLVAGALPWVTWGALPLRILGLPLFLAGLMVSGAALRVWSLGRRVPSAPPVERGCDGCVCGRDGGCSTAAALGESSASA
jgi:hypothetical protein